MIFRKHLPRTGTFSTLLVTAFMLVPTLSWANQQLVVVRKNGQTTSHVAKAGSVGLGANSCMDENVAFAFTVEPRNGVTSIELQRGTDTSADVVLNVTLTCSRLQGTALVPFDAAGGTAVRGSDYLSTPGMALLNLVDGAAGGSAAPVPATVRIELLDGGQTSQNQTLNVVRTEGSFQAIQLDGSPIVGTIPGSNAPLVAVSILGQALIRDGAEIIPGIDPAANKVSVATTEFCGAEGGGSGSPGCLATQNVTNLIVNPDTPADVRQNANVVLENNLLAIAPDETTAIAFVAPLLATGQFDNLSGRLAELRAGDTGGKVSAGGLTFISNGSPLSLASLGPLLSVDDDESARNEEKRTLLGGTRLGLWVSGTVGGGDADRRESNTGFKSDTWDLTSGVDYRFSDRFFAGAALGYSQFSADYSLDQGSLDANSRSLHIYSGYSIPNGFSLDASVSYMSSDYTQKRVIELYELNDAGDAYSSLGRDIAVGKQGVNQLGANFGVTYTIMRGTWTIAPQAQLSVLRTDYDSFTETGPSEFNLSYSDRKANSTSFSVGSYFDRTFATSVGAFRPYLRAYFFADSGSSKDLLASFARNNIDGTQTPLSLSMEEPDRRYGTAELGLSFSRPIGTRTVDFNTGFMKTFSFQDVDRWALRFDVRFPL
ncbi:MAG TPA: autotransporter outer membrane beta-barrel domain-containing protein [Dokdonella sp.]|uniref:autotransporter outer membrane beta-barrel domain-containing protein n=1 Tax=Dokdonella sp. TaxID=2291710 RepID=UPI002D7FB344|nr:autotransporter outer membrane beta-barrel domain-containing protein [Dokdonella sp.]HET9033634.1 autotransporter outer membrane beta-barrel domain-containing protein [Dokdonella sp.]